MPARLSDLAPNETPIFLPRLLSQRPKLAALLAETISTWSYAEHALGRSVAAMSRGINSAEMEDYIADWRLPKRLKILRRIAGAELQDPHLSLFLKVLRIIEKLAKRRHVFAHGVWGTVEALPDALLLIDAEHLFRHWGAANDFLAVFSQGGPPAVSPVHLDNRHIEVWAETEFKDEIAHMNQAVEFAFALELLASVDTFDVSNARRTQAYNWLLQQPLVSSAP
ncbi:hypothetical protein [Rhodopila sp.]|uniref:hypothetical protein n=1 Tax=Rhodopila sp. TaxID=2480087 RepID=UPI003D0B94EB